MLSKGMKRSERERRIDRLMEIRQEYAEKAVTRSLAAILIVAGSLMGVLSGFMLLSSNPDDLITSSLFKESDSVDISGHALHNNTGEGVEGVTITLIDPETGAKIDNTTSDHEGFYRFEEVKVQSVELVAIKDGFKTMKRTFVPDQSGETPLTMHEGEGVIEEVIVIPESLLTDAIRLSTLVAAFTLITAFFGIYAAHEARKGKRYRRSQYLSGIALCSRGFIIFGPVLILMGMVLLVMVKEQFADHVVDVKSRSEGDA